jgi:hypothetical protein
MCGCLTFAEERLTKIARPIGPADMEFFEGAIVMKMAHILSGKSGEDWDKLSHRTKGKWLTRASVAASDLFSDALVVSKLPALTKNLLARQ